MPFDATKRYGGAVTIVNGSLRMAERGLSLLIALVMAFGLIGGAAKADAGACCYLVGSMNGRAVNWTCQLTENPGHTGE